MTPLGTTPWRVGRSVGRTLYDCEDRLIGVVDTPDIALLVVEAVNGYFGKGVEPKLFPPRVAPYVRLPEPSTGVPRRRPYGARR